MLLERIFLKTGEDKENKLDSIWHDERRGNVTPLSAIDSTKAGFKQTAIVLAGLSTENGKILNPQDIMTVHKLNSYFHSYKYRRLRFFKSDWANNKLIY